MSLSVLYYQPIQLKHFIYEWIRFIWSFVTSVSCSIFFFIHEGKIFMAFWYVWFKNLILADINILFGYILFLSRRYFRHVCANHVVFTSDLPARKFPCVPGALLGKIFEYNISTSTPCRWIACERIILKFWTTFQWAQIFYKCSFSVITSGGTKLKNLYLLHS